MVMRVASALSSRTERAGTSWKGISCAPPDDAAAAAFEATAAEVGEAEAFELCVPAEDASTIMVAGSGHPVLLRSNGFLLDAPNTRSNSPSHSSMTRLFRSLSFRRYLSTSELWPPRFAAPDEAEAEEEERPSAPPAALELEPRSSLSLFF